ncbi:sugar ABC transporter substrate-binding protein [Paenibacillus sp. LHD-117]|uniref:ABC transporter substrate-binding protein n=1 Tax=Paenibacillus sp. LHD-117 TaxID=3071412 RepID=UPI0027E04769|nr:sugar ABC transporter substrate-binding protein [Paenibacillus sp. LHD-117]MDQ6421010.1 sugar ABC transporter substrate-binding protein [Paenibacillus sp. LHD-117]
MRKIGLLLTAMMMVTVIAACSNNNEGSATNAGKEGVGSDQKDVTIKFMTYTASGGQEETIEAMIKLFEEANPGIKVDLQVMAYSDYFTKLNTVIGGGSAAPDVFEVGYEGFASYASKDVLLDLTPFIEADASFDPGVFKKLAYDAFQYEGKQYGVSESFSNVVLYYNKDLFDAAGLDYPAADWTWEDELAAAKKLTDAAQGVWGTYAPLQFWEFYKTIAQNGGGIWSADGKTATVNSKENVEALEWMIAKASEHKVSPALNDDTFNQPDADLNAFLAGKLGMLRGGIWNFGRFKDAPFQWDIALEPGNTNKGHHFFADGLVASKSSKNGEAAWKFIKFISSDPAAVALRIEKGWSVPAVADEAVMKAYYEQTPPASKQVVSEALDSLVLPPVGAIPDQWNELTGAVGEELEKAKLGQIDAQTALDNAQKKVEELLK